jgi:hypothetical protein
MAEPPLSDTDSLDEWYEGIEEEFWNNPEEVRQFEEWLEKLYARYYGDEDDMEEMHDESCIPEPVDVKIEELPF